MVNKDTYIYPVRCFDSISSFVSTWLHT